MEPLPANLVLRLLECGDFDKGYLELLAQLTVVGNVSKDKFDETLLRLQKFGDDHRVLVIEDVHAGRIVATGSVLIEHKFIRNCGKVGHLEDVVVDRSARGCHLGQRVIEELTNFAKVSGCYKVILDCKQENAAFYEKCGYSRKEIQMARYF